MTKATYSLRPYHYDVDGVVQLANDGITNGKPLLNEQQVFALGENVEVHSWAGTVFVGDQAEVVYWYVLNYLGEWTHKSCAFSTKEAFSVEAKKLGRKMLKRQRKAA